MTHGRKTGGRNFVKGVVANPFGRTPCPPELRELLTSAKVEVLTALSKSLLSDQYTLKQMSESPNASTAQILIASVIARAVREGCPHRTQFLLQYIIGKPKVYEPAEMTGDDDVEAKETLMRDMLDAIPSSVLASALRQHETQNASAAR